VDPVSALIINKALDGLAMRSAAIADNIANAGSDGFRPGRVRFEEALRTAAGQGAQAIRSLAPQVEQSTAAPGQEVRLDLELASATETSLRYAALLNLLSRQMQISRTVVRGGQ